MFIAPRRPNISEAPLCCEVVDPLVNISLLWSSPLKRLSDAINIALLTELKNNASLLTELPLQYRFKAALLLAQVLALLP